MNLLGEIGSDLVGLDGGGLRLPARVVDARLRVLADLLALGDRLVRLRRGVGGGLARVLRGLVDAARVHQRQLDAVLVDAVDAIGRALAGEDAAAVAGVDPHAAASAGEQAGRDLQRVEARAEQQVDVGRVDFAM